MCFVFLFASWVLVETDLKSLIMKRHLLTILLAVLAFNAIGQINAVTDTGKKVILWSDGTWEYQQESNPIQSTSTVHFNGKKLISGEMTWVCGEASFDDLKTLISVAKDGDKTIIIFWQETTYPHINYSNELWKGTVTLFLENGETISLLDRGLKGQNKIPNGYKSGFSTKDLYQRWSAYYLTPAECSKLKRSRLSQIAHQTTEISEHGTTYLIVTENNFTIKEQLLAIGR